MKSPRRCRITRQKRTALGKPISHGLRGSLIALMVTTLTGCAIGRTAPNSVTKDATSPPTAPPNLILIVTDDQGYADVGFNGCTDIPTPHLDRIAHEGVRFTNGYVTYPVCGPSRAGMITGRYQDRFGFTTNPTIDPRVENNGVPREELNLAERLAPAGYTSMAVGKWHLGTHPDLRPRERGFDRFFGFLSGGHDYFPERLTLEDLSEVDELWAWYRTKLLEQHGDVDRRVSIDQYLTDALSDAAVDFVGETEGPFFLYLAYNAPHTPMQATPEYLERFAHITDENRRTYAAMVSAVDDGVGRILETLDERRLAENTLVVFLSDNGGATNNASRNDPMRGFKGSEFEGGLRVPFAMRWPAALPAGVDEDRAVSALDITGTILAAVDRHAALHGGAPAARDPERPIDGVDLLPFLTNDPDLHRDGQPHDQLFWRLYGKDMLIVRRDHDKLVRRDREGEPNALFNLQTDLGETTNRLHRNRVGDAERTLQTELNARLDAWQAQLAEPAFPSLGSWMQ